MNKVIIMGNLARDPEIRYTQSAEPMAIARFTVAVSRRFKRDDQDTDFVGCVAFGKQAEFMEKYFKKGMKAGVVGRLQVRTYDDNTGQRKWVTEVVAEEVEFAESRSAYEARMAQQGQYQPQYDSMVEQYNPPGAGASYGQSPPSSGYEKPAQPPSAPEGFAAITESIDDDDLPF